MWSWSAEKDSAALTHDVWIGAGLLRKGHKANIHTNTQQDIIVGIFIHNIPHLFSTCIIFPKISAITKKKWRQLQYNFETNLKKLCDKFDVHSSAVAQLEQFGAILETNFSRFWGNCETTLRHLRQLWNNVGLGSWNYIVTISWLLEQSIHLPCSIWHIITFSFTPYDVCRCSANVKCVFFRAFAIKKFRECWCEFNVIVHPSGWQW